MVEEGIWGSWLPSVSGSSGNFLCGFSFTEDNSVELSWIGMDGLKPVFCSAADWSQSNEVVAAEKQAGEWKKVLCPAGSYVQGA